MDIKKSLDKYKISKLLKGPYDAEGACVIIEAGSEGELSEVCCLQSIASTLHVLADMVPGKNYLSLQIKYKCHSILSRALNV